MWYKRGNKGVELGSYQKYADKKIAESGQFKPDKAEFLGFALEQGDACRYCKGKVEKENAALTASYWSSGWYLCHKDCKQRGEKEEAYECQIIDADCNDCKHFKRGDKTDKGIFEGLCLKFNKQTKAYPNYCSSHACFEHRRR